MDLFAFLHPTLPVARIADDKKLSRQLAIAQASQVPTPAPPPAPVPAPDKMTDADFRELARQARFEAAAQVKNKKPQPAFIAPAAPRQLQIRPIGKKKSKYEDHKVDDDLLSAYRVDPSSPPPETLKILPIASTKPQELPYDEFADLIGEIENPSPLTTNNKTDDDDLYLVIELEDQPTPRNNRFALLLEEEEDFMSFNDPTIPQDDVLNALSVFVHVEPTDEFQFNFQDDGTTVFSPAVAVETRKFSQRKQKKKKPTNVTTYDPLLDEDIVDDDPLDFIHDLRMQRQVTDMQNTVARNVGKQVTTSQKEAQSASMKTRKFVEQISKKHGLTGTLAFCPADNSLESLSGLSKLCYKGYPTKQVFEHVDVTLRLAKPMTNKNNDIVVPDPTWYDNWHDDPEISNMFKALIYEEPTQPFHWSWIEKNRSRPEAALNKIIHPKPRDYTVERTLAITIATPKGEITVKSSKTTPFIQKAIDEDRVVSTKTVPMTTMKLSNLLHKLSDAFNCPIPYLDEVQKSPSILQSVVLPLRHLYCDKDHVADIFKYIGLAVHRTILNARLAWMKLGVDKRDYQRIYNQNFGRVMHSSAVQQLYADATAHGKSTDSIAQDIVGAMASQIAGEKASTSYGKAKRNARTQLKVKRRDEKFAAYTEDEEAPIGDYDPLRKQPNWRTEYLPIEELEQDLYDAAGGDEEYFAYIHSPPPERSMMPQAKADGIDEAATSVISSVISAITKMLQDKLGSLWSELANTQLLWQSRLFHIIQLLIGLGSRDLVAMSTSVLGTLMSFYKIQELPDIATRFYKKIMTTEVPEPTKTWKASDGTNYTINFNRNEKVLELYLKSCLEDPDRERAQFNTTTAKHVKEYFRLPDDLASYAFEVLCLYWKANTELVVETSKINIPFFHKIPEFYELFIDMLGLTSFFSGDNKLKSFKNFCDAFNSIHKAGSTVSSMLRDLISCVCMWCFERDPFNERRNQLIKAMRSSINFLDSYTITPDIQTSVRYVSRYELAKALILSDKFEAHKPPNYLLRELNTSLQNNKPKYETCKLNINRTDFVNAPLGVMFPGPAGKGKTSACRNFYTCLIPMINRDEHDKPIPYTRSNTMPMPNRHDEHFEAYTDSTIHIHDDDAYGVIDQEQTLWWNGEIQHLMSDEMHTLDMAFDKKGKIFANFKLVTVCTNLINPERDFLLCQDATSIGRRFHLYVMVEDIQGENEDPFLDQHFLASGKYVPAWAATFNYPLLQTNTGMWHQCRLQHEDNPQYLVRVNGYDLLRIAQYSYYANIDNIKKVRLSKDKSVAVSEQIAAEMPRELRERLAALWSEHTPKTEVLAKAVNSDFETGEVKMFKGLKIDHVEKMPPKPEKSKMAHPNNSFDDFVKAFDPDLVNEDLSKPPEPKEDGSESIFSQIKNKLTEYKWPLMVMTAFISGYWIWDKYFTVFEHSQSAPTSDGSSRDATKAHKGVGPKMRTVRKNKSQMKGVDPRVAREISWMQCVADVDLIFEDEDGTTKIIDAVHGVFINAQNLLIPGHFQYMGEISRVNVHDYRKKYINLVPTEIFNFPDYDLVVLRLPPGSTGGLTPHRSIEKCCVSEVDEHGKPHPPTIWVNRKLRYINYDVNNKHCHATNVYCERVGHSFYEDPDGTQHHVSSTLRFQRGFEDGTCGNLYSVVERGTSLVCGFHICGSDTTGGAVLITSQLLQFLNSECDADLDTSVKLLEPPDFVYPNGDDGTGVISLEIGTHSEEDEVFEKSMIKNNPWYHGEKDFYGEIIIGKTTQMNKVMRGTKYSATPLKDCLPAEPDCVPINMYPHINKDGELVDPVAKTLRKKNVPRVKRDEIPYREEWLLWWNRNYPPLKHPHHELIFSLDEALNGKDGMPPFPTNTSIGAPYKTYHGTQKKNYTHRDAYDRLRLNEDAQQWFDACHVQARKGERFRVLFAETCKDETLPRTDKLRLFGAGPYVLTLLYRMYFGRFEVECMKDAFMRPMSIGINVHDPHEWKGLLDYLTHRCKIGRFIDAQNFDASLQNFLLLEVYHDIISRYPDVSEEDIKAMWVVAWNSFHTYTVFEDIVYESIKNFSGHGGTGRINCTANLRMLFTAWIALCYKYNVIPDYEDFRAAVYGDDNATFDSTRDNRGRYLPWEETASYLKEMFGLTVTDTDKESGLPPFAIKKMSEWSYLSRSWVYEAATHLWQAPLPIARISSMLTYMKNWDNSVNVQTTLNSAAIELTHHGKHTFNHWRQTLLRHPWIREQGLHMWTYELAMSTRIGFKPRLLFVDDLMQAPLPNEPISLEKSQLSVISHWPLTQKPNRAFSYPTEQLVQNEPNTTKVLGIDVFEGNGAKIESSPQDISMSKLLPGPVGEFKIINRRVITLATVDVTNSTAEGTTLATFRFPSVFLNDDVYKRYIQEYFVTYKRCCIFVEFILPPMAIGALEIVGGLDQVDAGSSNPDIRLRMNYQVVIRETMTEDNCIEIPFDWWQGVLDYNLATAVSSKGPGTTLYLKLLSTITAGFGSPTQNARVIVRGYLDGMQTCQPTPVGGFVALPTTPRPATKMKTIKKKDDGAGPADAPKEKSKMSGRVVKLSRAEAQALFGNESSEQASNELGAPVTHIGDASHGIAGLVSGVSTAASAVGEISGKVASVAAHIEAAAKSIAQGNVVDESRPRPVETKISFSGPSIFKGVRMTAMPNSYRPDYPIGKLGEGTDVKEFTQRPTMINNNDVAVNIKQYGLVTPCMYQYLQLPSANSETGTAIPVIPSWCATPAINSTTHSGAMKYWFGFYVPGATGIKVEVAYLPNVVCKDLRHMTIVEEYVSKAYFQGTGKLEFAFSIPHSQKCPAIPNWIGVPHTSDNVDFNWCWFDDMESGRTFTTQQYDNGVLRVTITALVSSTNNAMTSARMVVYAAGDDDMTYYCPTIPYANPVEQYQSLQTYSVLPDAAWIPDFKSKNPEKSKMNPRDLFRSESFQALMPSFYRPGVPNYIFNGDVFSSYFQILRKPISYCTIAGIGNVGIYPDIDTSAGFLMHFTSGSPIYNSNIPWIIRIFEMFTRWYGSVNVGVMTYGLDYIKFESFDPQGLTAGVTAIPQATFGVCTNEKPYVEVQLPYSTAVPYSLFDYDINHNLNFHLQMTPTNNLNREFYFSVGDDFRLGLVRPPLSFQAKIYTSAPLLTRTVPQLPHPRYFDFSGKKDEVEGFEEL